MIGRLNHVAIAVPDIEAATAHYRDTLGAKIGEKQSLAEHGVTVVFIELPNPSPQWPYPKCQSKFSGLRLDHAPKRR